MNGTDSRETSLVKNVRFAYGRGAGTVEADAGGPSVAAALVWLALAVIYFIMPDFIPGPVDDFLLNAAAVVNVIMAMKAHGGGRNGQV